MHDRPDVTVLVDRLRSELLTILKQRDEVAQRIAMLRRTIAGLINLFGRDVVDKNLLRVLGYPECQRRPGLTQECRLVLMSARSPLTARELCDQIQKKAGVFDNHQNPIASIRVVLNRLIAYGEVRAIVEDRPHRYQWIV